MIDEYIDEQKIITTVLKNAVEKNKISHAYLFETNGYQNKDDFVLAFIKYLLCPHNYSNSKNCVNCTQCELIQKRIFSEVKHIYSDGMWIKKEQLEELQQNFSETSVESNKRIYVKTGEALTLLSNCSAENYKDYIISLDSSVTGGAIEIPFTYDGYEFKGLGTKECPFEGNFNIANIKIQSTLFAGLL